MIRRVYPGGLYIDAWPTGEYVVLYPGSRFETHFNGRLPLPEGEAFGLMFIDCTTIGGFQFAGLAHDIGRILWFDGKGWQRRDSITPPVFDNLGTLIDYPVLLSGGEVSSHGWRFVNDHNQPVSEQDTYYDQITDLSQWTEHAGFRVGQGNDVGIRFRDDTGVIRQFGYLNESAVFVPELGSVSPPKFHVSGNQWAMSYYVENLGALSFTGTLDELRAMPAYAPSTPPVDPPPVDPPPPPPPEIPMTLPQNIKAIRDRFVSRYPVPQGPTPADDAFENVCRSWILDLAEQVVFETGDASWGVKNAGGGRPQSKDSLAHQDGGRLINFDLLSGVGTGRPTLVADPQGEDITGQTFMPVQPVDHLGSTPPPNNPPPDDDAIKQLTKSVAALNVRADSQQAQIVGIKAELLTSVEAYRAIVDRVTALEQVKPTDGVKHGDPVEVTGTIGYRDVVLGRMVTWQGKIK